jgi:hypothetical protein
VLPYTHSVSMLHIPATTMEAAQDQFATRQVGSVRPGYNILAVSYSSDNIPFAF